MGFTRKIVVLIFIGLGFTVSLWSEESPHPGVIFVIDKSGSMDDMLPEIKNSVSDIISAFPTNHQAGLVTFDGCADDAIQYPVVFGKRTGPAILKEVGELEADGGTALDKALKFVDSIMLEAKACPRVIVFTDSDDTCEGNPVDFAEKWSKREKTMCSQVDIISSSPEASVQKNLEKIATMLGGNLWLADNSEQYYAAIARIIARERQNRDSNRLTDAQKKDGSLPTDGYQDEAADQIGEPENEKLKAKATQNKK